MVRKKGRRKKVKRQDALLERRSLVFLLFLIFFLLIFSLFGPKNQVELAKQRLSQGEDFESRLVLAEEFLRANDLAGAERELLAASRLESQKKVLGASSRLAALWQQKRARDPEEIRAEIRRWEKVLAGQPGYRDALLRLALYHYLLGNRDEAKEYLDRALKIDPNFNPAKNLEKFLQ